MVPGPTLMDGSSLRVETRRPRGLNRRPMLAAVMPLPREEVTPPVTKTYFAMGRVLRGFFECYRKRPPEASRIGGLDRPELALCRPCGAFRPFRSCALNVGHLCGTRCP